MSALGSAPWSAFAFGVAIPADCLPHSRIEVRHLGCGCLLQFPHFVWANWVCKLLELVLPEEAASCTCARTFLGPHAPKIAQAHVQRSRFHTSNAREIASATSTRACNIAGVLAKIEDAVLQHLLAKNVLLQLDMLPPVLWQTVADRLEQIKPFLRRQLKKGQEHPTLENYAQLQVRHPACFVEHVIEPDEPFLRAF